MNVTKSRSNEMLMEINGVVIGKITKRKDFEHFISGLQIEAENYVIKPNWSNANNYTSAETLELLFQFLNGKKTVIESYTAWRNELNTGPEPVDVITPRNAKRKWKWIKEQDEWFLDYSGIGKVLRSYDVNYINITEEVWSGRTVDAKEIKKIVETEFSPVKQEELYGYVPQKVYNLKGGLLISFNMSRKTREMASLSIKNLFGLIPDPARYGKWHGPGDQLLPQSIIDINKIYRSLFETLWINEIKNLRLLIGGDDSVKVDVVTAYVMGIDPKKIPYLNLATATFGDYDETLLGKIPANLLKCDM